MVYFFILAFVILLIVYCKFALHLEVKFKTFLKKGFIPVRGDFGIYNYDGKQGKGKTYSIVEYLIDNSPNILVYSNIHDIQNVEHIHYFDGFDGLIDIKHSLDNGCIVVPKELQLVIVYDELFTELQKTSKLSSEVLDFLCQMRKRHIIFLTTCQEWAELPLSFRRFCRYRIKCDMFSIGFDGILIKRFYDAENMKWSEEEQDFSAPLTNITITKCRKFISNSYDTFLRISPVNLGGSTPPKV